MRRIAAIAAGIALLFGLSACTHDTEDTVYTPVIVEVNGRSVECISMIDYYNGESAFSCNWYGAPAIP